MAYSTYGFWKKEGTYYEQPIVQYQHKLALLIESSAGVLAFSTVPEFNLVSGFSNVRVPQIQSFSDDPNVDGRTDFFNLTVTVPILDNEKIYGISALIFYDVELKNRMKLKMTAMTQISHSSALPGSKLSVFGDVRFKQLYPLSLKGSRADYTSELLDGSSITSIEDTYFSDIIAQSFARNGWRENIPFNLCLEHPL